MSRAFVSIGGAALVVVLFWTWSTRTPRLVIQQPASGERLDSRFVQVQCSCDAADGTPVFVNEVPCTVRSGACECLIPLVRGINSIRASVGGAVAETWVVAAPTPLQFRHAEPQSGSEVSGDVQVRAELSDPTVPGVEIEGRTVDVRKGRLTFDLQVPSGGKQVEVRLAGERVIYELRRR